MRRIKKMRRLYLCGSTERDQPSIKDFVPERFLLVTLVVAAMDVVVMIAAIWLALRRWRHRRLSSDFLGAALDKFVEFASIQPYATALWAVIDFDILARGHCQVDFFANRAFHTMALSES